jgi:geranylgeranyl pyrophosphate synthase
MALPSISEDLLPLQQKAARQCKSRLFQSYLAEVRPQMEERLLQHILRSDAKVEMGRNLMALLLGGKRLRGGLTMLVFDAFSDDGADRGIALDLATAIELAHASSLVLDDIIDEDDIRRGSAAVHMLEGEKRAILRMVGAISLPYTIASSCGNAFVAPLAEVHRRMVRGVLAEMSEPISPTNDDYDRIITLKTGELFGLAAYYGAIVAGCEPGLTLKLSRFGLEAGKVMQMADDIADLRKALNRAGHVSSGSEMILLRTVIPNDLSARLEEDMRARRLTSVQTKLQEAMGPDWLEQELRRHLDAELKKMAEVTDEIWSCDAAFASVDRPLPEIKALLCAAPGEIANMMFEGLEAEHQ